MNNLFLSAFFMAISSMAMAESSVSAKYITLDGTLSSGGVSVAGDGDGYSLNGTLDIGDTSFVAAASLESISGTIGTAAWSLDSTLIGVGYKIVDELDDDSGLQLVAGVGYISSSGDFTSGGTKYILGADSTILLGQARAKTGASISVAGEVVLDLEGDSDPTFSVGLAYDITDTGSIDFGYSANNSTSSSGVTSDLTGWSVGYRISF